MKKIRISELPQGESFDGAWIICTDANGNSVKMPLGDKLADFQSMIDLLTASANDESYYMLAGTQTFRKGSLNVRAVGGQFPWLSFSGLEAGLEYTILLFNASSDYDVTLHSESGTPLYRIGARKPVSVTTKADEQGYIKFLTSTKSSEQAMIYWLIGETDNMSLDLKIILETEDI